MTLDGTITPVATGEGGLTNTMGLHNQLRAAFTQEGCPFVIKCDDTTLWSGHPVVGDLTFERTNNNWIETIDYTIPLVFYTEGSGNAGSGEDPSLMPPYIQEASESWSLEFADTPSKYSNSIHVSITDTNPTVMNMSHSISARGSRHYTDCDTISKEPWEYAKDYVISKLSTGRDAAFNTQLDSSGVINLNSSSFNSFNHIRTQQNDIANGSYSCTESWIVTESGFDTGALGLLNDGRAIEDFSVNIQQSTQSDITTVTVDGSVQGLEVRDYSIEVTGTGNRVTETKYENAASGWASIHGFYLINRARTAYNAIAATYTPFTARGLLSTPTSNTIGHSYTQGRITYSYTYDDRPGNCITGAVSEVINISDNNPNDVYAKIAVLGRALGPVLQDVGTISETTRNVSIELVTAPIAACTAAGLRVPPNEVKTDVAALLCEFQTELSGTYNQVFLNSDVENWSPKEGRYSRNVSWTYQDCDITGSTSMC
jgi:hypothetical protein